MTAMGSWYKPTIKRPLKKASAYKNLKTFVPLTGVFLSWSLFVKGEE